MDLRQVSRYLPRGKALREDFPRKLVGMRKTFGKEGESMLYILEVTRTQGLEFRGEI